MVTESHKDGKPMLDAMDIWKLMGEERRLKAALALYLDPEQKDNRYGMDGIIAQLRHFRPQFVKKLPPEKRAQYAATLPIPAEAVAQLIVAYHFAHQRPLMAAFLDQLGIANDKGQIQSDTEPQPPDAARLQEATAKICASFDRTDVFIYLSTLHAQGTPAWAGLGALLEKLD